MTRYEYSCSACGGSVSKPETGKVVGKTKVGLGGWKCQKCGPTKVIRKLSGN